MTDLPDVMTAAQLIEFLGQDKADVYRALRAGKIPGAHRRGKHWVVGTDAFIKAATGGWSKPKPKVAGSWTR